MSKEKKRVTTMWEADECGETHTHTHSQGPLIKPFCRDFAPFGAGAGPGGAGRMW